MGRSLAGGLAVVGNGYVGTVVAACFAALGRSVVGVEVDQRKLESLRNGRAPFYEPDLDLLLTSGLRDGRLRFTDDFRGVMAASDVIFLCVSTQGTGNGRVDLAPLEAAVRTIGSSIERDCVLVTKSTVPTGTSRRIAALVEEVLPAHLRDRRPYAVLSNPEFLREGSAIRDFLHPKRIILGGEDPRALDTLVDVYRPILDQSFPGGDPDHRPRVLRTSSMTAEAVKFASNAFLAMRVSFINEIANVCELIGIDVTEVAHGLGLDPRIGDQYLDAGIGWGGSCLRKDLDMLVSTATERGYDPLLLQAVRAVNDRQRLRAVEKLRHRLGTVRGRRVGLLGLSFKPGTDDLRDAPALDIAARLLAGGAEVTAHDPVVKRVPSLPNLRLATDPYEAADGVDAVVLVTEWPEFLTLDLQALRARMRGELLLDLRNAYDPATVTAAGLRHEPVGRAPSIPDPSLVS